MERSATARVVAVAVGLAGVVAGQVVLAREGPTVVASVLVLAGLVGVVWPAGHEIDRLDPPVPPTSPTSFVAPTSSGRTGRDGPGLPMLAVAGLANCAYDDVAPQSCWAICCPRRPPTTPTRAGVSTRHSVIHGQIGRAHV